MKDVGSGSGYLTSCLARLSGDDGKVIGLETIKELVEIATENINLDDPTLLKSGKIVLKRMVFVFNIWNCINCF